MSADGPRIGILGGTFDPIHLGHLASAKDVAAAFQLERVLLVPAATPPHKIGREITAAPLRWEMVKLAIEEEQRRDDALSVEACDVEMTRAGPSWTVDTLLELQRQFPNDHLFLILGIDAYNEIDTWSRSGEILQMASVIVTDRPGNFSPTHPLLPPIAARGHARYDSSINAHIHNSGHALYSHHIRGVEASSTEIRSLARRGLPIEEFTGPAVARFVTERGLYRNETSGKPTNAAPPHHGRSKPS